MRNRKYIAGIVLIVAGIVLILGNIGILDLSWMFRLTWPLVLLIISGLFFMGYASRRPYGTGMLVPAGLFLTLGITCLLGEIFGYRLMWPGFVAAPAVGLLLLYLYGPRSGSLLVPIGTLLSIAGISFISELFGIWSAMWPWLIMTPAVGLFLLYISGNQKNSLLLFPIVVLTVASVTLFTVTLFSFPGFMDLVKYIVGGILILGGLVIILNRPGGRRDSYYHDDSMHL
jgi:hypothetical protein